MLGEVRILPAVEADGATIKTVAHAARLIPARFAYVVARNAPEEVVVTLRPAAELPIGTDGMMRVV